MKKFIALFLIIQSLSAGLWSMEKLQEFTQKKLDEVPSLLELCHSRVTQNISDRKYSREGLIGFLELFQNVDKSQNIMNICAAKFYNQALSKNKINFSNTSVWFDMLKLKRIGGLLKDYCITHSSNLKNFSLKILDIQPLLTLENSAGPIYGIAFSPDSTILASCSQDKTITLYNAKTGKELQKLYGHTQLVNAVVFSQDGTLLASGSWDKTVRIWNLSTGVCIQVLEGHTGRIHGVTFSQDNKKIVSCSCDQTVRIWDLTANKCIQVLEGHTGSVYGVVFFHDDKKIASCSWDATIRIWDLETNKAYVLDGHNGSVLALAFSQKNNILASCSVDETIRLWNAETGVCTNELKGHTNNITGITFSTDGTMLLSCSADGTARLWNSITGECIKIFSDHSHRLAGVAFASDNQMIATCSHDETVLVYNLFDKERLTTLFENNNFKTVMLLEFILEKIKNNEAYKSDEMLAMYEKLPQIIKDHFKSNNLI